MKLDMERLHSIIEQIQDPTKKEFIPRGAGMTTAYYYLMLDEARGGDFNNTYLYLSGNYGAAARHIPVQFCDLLNDYYPDSVVTVRNSNVVQCSNGQSFRFAPISDALNDNFWRGMHYDRVFVDVRQYDLPSPHKEALYYEIRTRGGDLV